MFDITGKHRAMTERSTKIYLWPSSVLNTFVKRTPGLQHQYRSKAQVFYFILHISAYKVFSREKYKNVFYLTGKFIHVCLKMTKAQACGARAAGQHKQNSMLAQQKLRSACTSAQSCQSPCQPLYASLEPRASSAKKLIRSNYSGCVVWSESSQDTQVIL